MGELDETIVKLVGAYYAESYLRMFKKPMKKHIQIREDLNTTAWYYLDPYEIHQKRKIYHIIEFKRHNLSLFPDLLYLR